ncbi:hypothetical protein [uncultured Acinetobacter sp.]|uniref:hypothetical protein n=1 Tax=uncultured Acinetobacter sp. TaxID=165433 RepID=UPI0026061E3F|nr:hypothetical protein [uncultured Acinetobacter sp.]
MTRVVPMKTNLFIVFTPFQLFNVLEAKNRFHKNDNNILLFIDKGNPKNKAQVDYILSQNSFDQYHTIDYISSSDKLFNQKKKNALLTQFGTVDTLYAGLFRNISAHCINTLKPKHVVIVDDGNRTLRVVKDFFSGKRKNEATRFLDALLGKKTDLSFIYQATFFSIYPQIATQVPHFIHNDYQCLKQKNQRLTTQAQSFIIGSKLVSDTLSAGDFEKIIALMCQHDTREKVYLPHRHEDLDYLETLAKRYDFRIVVLPTILEYSLLGLGYRPERLYSIRSTAADTLHQLYDIPVTIFRPDVSMIMPEKQKELSLVYQHYQAQNYQMVDVQ